MTTRSVEQTKEDIEQRLGFIPPFFEPAFSSELVLENLWYQTRSAYLDNPLPALFKEKLAALLGSYCVVPYCLMCHSSSLRPLGMKAADILELLQQPAPGFSELQRQNEDLTHERLADDAWPEPGSALDSKLLSCSVALFLSQDVERCQNYLRAVLGATRYDLLILFIAYNRTALTWAEAHPELAHGADRRVIDNLGALLEAEPELDVFFRTYANRSREQEERRAQWLSQQNQVLLSRERDLRQAAEQAQRELATTASWLNATLLSIGDAVIAVSAGAAPSIEFMNAVAEELTGWRLEEARGKPVLEVFDIVNVKTRQPAANPISRAIAEGRAVGLANHTALISRSGREYIIEDSAAPILAPDGAVNGVVLVFRDATEKHALEERSALLSAVIENSRDFIGIARPDGTAYYVNPAGRELMGMSGAEHVAKTAIIDYFAEHERARVRSSIMPQLREAGAWDGRICFENFTTGEAIPVSWNVFSIPDLETGGVAAIACVSRDLRAEEAGQRAMAEVRRAQVAALGKLEAMFTISPMGIALVAGSDFIFERVNETFGKLVSAREYIGRRWLDVYPELADSGLVEAMTAVFVSGRPFEAIDTQLRVGDDGAARERYHDITFTRVLDGSNIPYGVLIQCAEVTERVRTRLRMLDNERLLGEARDEAERANRAKSTFLANMSHEIRTPLGAIMGFAELVAQPRIPRQEIDRYVSVIQRNSSQLLRIIDDILDLSKVEAGKMEIESVRFSLTEMLSDLSSILGLRARENSIAFEMHAATSLPNLIIADPTRLRQILFNVVGNAIKFTDSGVITLTVSSTTRTLRFEVADTGAGISPEQAARLFMPFSQADAATNRRYGGTGLGLVLTRSLCQAMGGDFFLLHSELGQGSTFVASIEIEVASDSRRVHDVDIAFSSAMLQPDDEARTLADMKLLLVEDSPDNRELIQVILTQAGARVEIAVDGREGVAKALANDYDAILMDVQMPRMDGIEAVSELRARGLKAPIIALTAHAMKEQRQRSLRVGFTHFMAKPVQRQPLLQVLQAIYAENRAERARASEAARQGDIESALPSRVLVVDDDDDTRELMCTLLDGQGFETAVAATGAEALEVLGGDGVAPSLIILDMTLPDMTGEDVLRVLNHRGDRASLRVVLASGWDLAPRLTELGADAFLLKPISFTALLAIVRPPSV